LLEIKGISKSFGGLKAVNRVTLNVPEGRVVGLIGPNGAGKTTLFNLITGIYRLDEGTIFFKGMEVTGKKPHEIAGIGIARTFQTVSLFYNQTVLQNVLMSHFLHFRSGFSHVYLRLKRLLAEEEEALESSRALLNFVGLSPLEDVVTKDMSLEAQRRLSIAMALSIRPHLLLLDEPVGGMTSEEAEHIVTLLKRIKARGISIFLIEHRMKTIMGVSDQIVVLDHGEKIAEGAPEKIRDDPVVIKAYLGQDYVLPS
jgi:branched-chain amino acid transport system ATP-binding protein